MSGWIENDMHFVPGLIIFALCLYDIDEISYLQPTVIIEKFSSGEQGHIYQYWWPYWDCVIIDYIVTWIASWTIQTKTASKYPISNMSEYQTMAKPATTLKWRKTLLAYKIIMYIVIYQTSRNVSLTIHLELWQQ